MTTWSTIVSSTLLLSSAQILNPLTSVLLVLAIARLQGAEILGKYSLVLTIFYMAVAIAGLGLNTPITRAISVNKNKAPDFLIVSSLIGLATGLIAIGGVQILIFLLDYPPDVQISANLLMWAVIPSVLVLFYEAIFIAFHKVPIIATVSIVENICKVAIGLILLTTGKDIFTLFLVIICLRFLVFVVYLLLFQVSIAVIVPQINWAIFAELWKVSHVFAANLLIGALSGRVDVLILSKLGTMADVGYYSAALRFIEIARLVPTSFMRAIFPVLCETYYSSRKTYERLFTQSVTYMIVFGVGTTLGIYLLTSPLITVLYGDDFTGAEPPLKILSFLMIPASLTPVFAALLFAANRELLDFFANIASTSLLVVLCMVLTPIWFSSGTAIALVISESILFMCLMLFMRTRIYKAKLLRGSGWPIVAGLMAYSFGSLVSTLPIALQGVLTLSVYMVLTLAFQPALREDLATLIHSVIDLLRKK